MSHLRPLHLPAVDVAGVVVGDAVLRVLALVEDLAALHHPLPVRRPAPVVLVVGLGVVQLQVVVGGRRRLLRRAARLAPQRGRPVDAARRQVEELVRLADRRQRVVRGVRVPSK